MPTDHHATVAIVDKKRCKVTTYKCHISVSGKDYTSSFGILHIPTSQRSTGTLETQ